MPESVEGEETDESARVALIEAASFAFFEILGPHQTGGAQNPVALTYLPHSPQPAKPTTA